MSVDEEIIKGLRSGDEKSYRYLYDYHYSILCKVAYGYVSDYATAEMIVSDIIYAIWKNRSELDINQSLRGYLMRAVKNSCLNYLHRQEKQIDISLLDEYTTDNMEIEAPPLLQLIEQELDLKIQACINQLPDLTREIFVLSRFKELKYDEIAKKLNVSVDVVKYHIKSALSKLRKELKDFLLILLFLFFL